MSAVLIGGMNRLHRKYIEAAKTFGINLKVFHGKERSIEKQLGFPDLFIICTGKVSHSARIEVLNCARANKIPVHIIQSPGLSALRCCFKECSSCNLDCPLQEIGKK